VGTNPATHRLSGKHNAIAVPRKPLGRSTMDRQQLRRAIGRPASRLRVCVVERHHAQPTQSQRIAQGDHERMILSGTGAVSEQDADAASPCGSRKPRRHLLSPAPSDDQPPSHAPRVAATRTGRPLASVELMTVNVYETSQQLAIAAADLIAVYLVDLDRDATLGLSGGSTPIATHNELARRDIDWGRVTMWMGDERWVPHDHPDSNTRMAHETLVDKVVGRLVAPDTAFGDPEGAARAYDRILAELFIDGRPDLVMLGIGDDGHTASLFPATDALGVDTSAYIANWVEQKDTWRLTASMPMLWAARELVFLVEGEKKAEVLARIIDDGEAYPAQQVAAGAPSVTWLIDAAAASRLRSVSR
jgi:6-phosphogluconolactonase